MSLSVSDSENQSENCKNSLQNSLNPPQIHKNPFLIKKAVTLQFDKWQGLGNDFVIIQKTALCEGFDLGRVAKQLCDRKRGIGADGLVVLSKSVSNFLFEIYNSDGSKAQICGNALRCFAKHIKKQKLIKEDQASLFVDTETRVIECSFFGPQVIVNMGHYTLATQQIPACFQISQVIQQPIQFDPQTSFQCTLVNVSNPHCVIYQQNVDSFHVNAYGTLIQSRRDLFPESINVEFVEVLDQYTLKMRVFERGCGETEACASGATAAVVSGVLSKKNALETLVIMKGGSLLIKVELSNQTVKQQGDAQHVFEGFIELELSQGDQSL